MIMSNVRPGTRMTRDRAKATSRRNFLKMTAATAAFGPFFLFPDRALAQQKTLKVAKWAHFLPEFDVWFQNVLAKEWGDKHDTKIIVAPIPVGQVFTGARAEAKPAKGRKFFSF